MIQYDMYEQHINILYKYLIIQLIDKKKVVFDFKICFYGGMQMIPAAEKQEL